MWFRQIRVFRLTNVIQSAAQFCEKLEALVFSPCLPSMPFSMGWTPPIDQENEPLVKVVNGCMMLCLKIEEKILPASVVQDATKEKIKQIEAQEMRRIGRREKLTLKDEMTQTLLPKAFCKSSFVYAYIDTRHQWLIVNGGSPKKIENFLTMYKKSFGETIVDFDVVQPATLLTHWLKKQSHPTVFNILESCVFQDPKQQTRMVRCQQQNLLTDSIQSLLKEGYEAIQLGLCWYDRLNFVLTNDFTIRNIQKADNDLIEIQEDIESAEQRFATDFLFMQEMFAGMLTDLLSVFEKKNSAEIPTKIAVAS